MVVIGSEHVTPHLHKSLSLVTFTATCSFTAGFLLFTFMRQRPSVESVVTGGDMIAPRFLVLSEAGHVHWWRHAIQIGRLVLNRLRRRNGATNFHLLAATAEARLGFHKRLRMPRWRAVVALASIAVVTVSILEWGMVSNGTDYKTLAASSELSVSPRPAQPAALMYYGDISPWQSYAHPGALVVTGRGNYMDQPFKDISAAGGTVLIYIDPILGLSGTPQPDWAVTENS
jgi:hypothetical protein